MPTTDTEDRVRKLLDRLSMPSALQALKKALPVDPAKKIAALKTLESLLAIEAGDRTERIKRRISEAKLPDYPTLQTFDFDFQPSLDRDLIMDLATLARLDRREDLLIIGQSSRTGETNEKRLPANPPGPHEKPGARHPIRAPKNLGHHLLRLHG